MTKTFLIIIITIFVLGCEKVPENLILITGKVVESGFFFGFPYFKIRKNCMEKECPVETIFYAENDVSSCDITVKLRAYIPYCQMYKCDLVVAYKKLIFNKKVFVCLNTEPYKGRIYQYLINQDDLFKKLDNFD
jgi:hypothetical protein